MAKRKLKEKFHIFLPMFYGIFHKYDCGFLGFNIRLIVELWVWLN